MLSSVRNRLLIITAVTIGLSYAVAAQTQPPHVVHVIVALADNTYQGIVPVPKAIGIGPSSRNRRNGIPQEVVPRQRIQFWNVAFFGTKKQTPF